jgi:hypothetical protein
MTMSGTAQAVDPQVAALYLRVLGGDLGATQLWFDQRVLDRYRAQPGWRVMRTNTVGRVRSPESWQLDFGIADDDQLIHASASDLIQGLPVSERQHWAQHVLAQPVSRNFLSIRMAPGSCFDDGDLRDFVATPETFIQGQ